MRLILASSSPCRRELLQRLGLPFEQMDPDFIEAQPYSRAPHELVRHNTMGKALSLLTGEELSSSEDLTIIGSDQIAVCGSTVLGKPKSIDQACAQLRLLSGKRVSFLTGLALVTAELQRFDLIPFDVHFRDLSDIEIETYVHIEMPLHCAGSFKSEGLGVSLFERLEGDDPTALIGLPLIRLSQWLKPLSLLSTQVAQE